jgi:predicted RNA-binding protein
MYMCDTNAYIKANGVEEMFLESLARIEVQGGMLSITNIFGEKKQLNGRITEINFQGGKVLLERL